MAKLIKGSKAAKAFMAKIRAKKAPKKSAKKVSGVKESAKLKKELAAKKLRLPHGYKTIKRSRKVKKLGSINKNTKCKNVKINNNSMFNKPYLKVSFSGHGHYKIETIYYNKTITCITTNMQAIDNYQSEDGSKRILKGFKSLRSEVIRKNKIYKY